MPGASSVTYRSPALLASDAPSAAGGAGRVTESRRAPPRPIIAARGCVIGSLVRELLLRVGRHPVPRRPGSQTDRAARGRPAASPPSAACRAPVVAFARIRPRLLLFVVVLAFAISRLLKMVRAPVVARSIDRGDRLASARPRGARGVPRETSAARAPSDGRARGHRARGEDRETRPGAHRASRSVQTAPVGEPGYRVSLTWGAAGSGRQRSCGATSRARMRRLSIIGPSGIIPPAFGSTMMPSRWSSRESSESRATRVAALPTTTRSRRM